MTQNETTTGADTTAAAVVRAAVARVAPDADLTTLAPDEDLFDVLELDSMDTLNIATVVEELTGIAIAERDYPKIRTLDDFGDYLAAAGLR